ncbi:MAG: AraC family transcriptional regulator ligand-binding domain-containing protein [Pseudomonadota bacterium]
MRKSQDAHVQIGKAALFMIVELGLDPETVLRRADLPSGLLQDEDKRISLEEFFQLWSAVAEEADDPLLPLKLGDASSIDYFDPAFFAAMCSPNMNVAAMRLADYKRRINPFTLDVQVEEIATQIAFQCLARTQVPPTLALTEIVFLVNFIRRATRQRIVPKSVSMPFSVFAAGAYEDHFGCLISKGTRASVTFSSEDAVRSFVTHNDEMWELFEPKLRRQIVSADIAVTTRSRVAHCLNEFLPSGRANVDEVARELAMSRRTLQRRLADEGTTWLEVLNDAREALAKHYLTASAYGATEVSFLLGFEDPNSFFRAFKRWENTSPELWREMQKTQQKLER